MAEPGSPDWIDALARSVAGIDAAGVAISVRHQIAGGPAWLVVADGRTIEVRPATDGEDGDVTFTWQADDAAAVASGETTVLAVFGTGRLRVGGDLRRLAAAAALFAGLPGVAA